MKNMVKNIFLVIYFGTILFTKVHLQPVSEETVIENQTKTPSGNQTKTASENQTKTSSGNQTGNLLKGDQEEIEAIKTQDGNEELICKRYYELFLQKLKEIERKPQEIDQESAQSLKYNVKVNNVGAQNLPYPERTFFNPNPDKNSPKPNSKGPITPQIYVNNYQYIPLDQQLNGINYLQPPLEGNPPQFSQQNQAFTNVLSLQNSLVSDGKMIYYVYNPNYQTYIPNNNNNYEKIGINKIDENEFSPSTESTSTSESTSIESTESSLSTISSTDNLKEIESNKIEGIKPHLYEHQLKFVFPIQFPKGDVINFPYDLDPYVYYPKELQPEFVNLQMPYVPTFHMIKRLTVPHHHEIETSLDDVAS